MRYPASEKLEMTLDKLGVPRRTFYRWYDRYLHYGEAGLVDRAPHPGRVWNKIWGWMYLSTVLDDFSRYIISWKLCTTMKTSDVTDTLNHVRGAPYHPQTQGKIERWHQTLKNRILLENYFLPGDLECQIESFVEHYNHERYHESLKNVTPADVYFGRSQSILNRRERIKKNTIEHRRLQYRKAVA